MNRWMLTKIITFLSNREGCDVYARNNGKEEERAVIQDAMGFRYEISVKLLGKTVLWAADEEPKLDRNLIKQIGDM